MEISLKPLSRFRGPLLASVTELRPELPRQLDRILRRCLAKSPKRRYQTALDASNELQDLRRELESGDSAGPTKAIPRIVAAAKRKRYRTPLVGRASEIEELGKILECAANGAGSLVMISGELGVGKSRLAEELAALARERGFLTMVGQCYEEAGTPPFVPWAEHLEYTARIAPRETLRNLLGDSAPEVAKLMPELRRMFPDIPPPLTLPPEQERHYLFNRFREYVERSSQLQPLLITLEDLQWADESTLLLLSTWPSTPARWRCCSSAPTAMSSSRWVARWPRRSVSWFVCGSLTAWSSSASPRATSR